MVDCRDCKHIDYDRDFNEDDITTCLKGHDLLLSMEIPDDCNDFGMW
jgi:hypothetical protein